MLVDSERGVWVVQQDGSRRVLGPYREASWSPFGRYVVAARKNELAAVEPDGTVRWTLARPDVSSPRWTGSDTDTRIAYLDRSGIRVVAGDGKGDTRLSARTGALAWRPGSTFVLGSVHAGELQTRSVASGRVLSHTNVGPGGVLGLQWTADGSRALVVHSTELDLVDVGRGTRQKVPSRRRRFVDAAFSPDGTRLAVLRASELTLVDARHPNRSPRRLFAGAGPFSEVTWSPDGRWLLVGWPAADQWVFVRADGKRIRAVSSVSSQFRTKAFPRVEGWIGVDK
jgi:WD40 repeat protein